MPTGLRSKDQRFRWTYSMSDCRSSIWTKTITRLNSNWLNQSLKRSCSNFTHTVSRKLATESTKSNKLKTLTKLPTCNSSASHALRQRRMLGGSCMSCRYYSLQQTGRMQWILSTISSSLGSTTLKWFWLMWPRELHSGRAWAFRWWGRCIAAKLPGSRLSKTCSCGELIKLKNNNWPGNWERSRENWCYGMEQEPNLKIFTLVKKVSIFALVTVAPMALASTWLSMHQQAMVTLE